MPIERIDPATLYVGQRFDCFGQIYEITKIERGKARTVRIARRIHDSFGKESLIDARSFPARDINQQYLTLALDSAPRSKLVR